MDQQDQQPEPKKKSKKTLWIVLGVVVILIVIGAVASNGNNTNSTGASSSDSSDSTFSIATTETEINNLKSQIDESVTYDVVNNNSDAYKGKVVKWGAKVFTTPEKDTDAIYLQAYADGENQNYAISYSKPGFDVQEGDYLIVYGQVWGNLEGENAFGAKLSMPAIKAGYIEKATRNDVVAPTLSEVTVNDSNTQNQFTVTLTKIELAKNETRVYLTLKNNGNNEISFYTYDTKLTQGSKQLESESLYDSDMELPSDILPGVEVEGFIAFPALETGLRGITLHLSSPYSSNYNLNWDDIKFDVTLP